jgi:uncharacterized protein YutE (UPF0331/DUF86 family)
LRIDRVKVEKIAREATAAINHLRDLEQRPAAEFLSDVHLVGSAKYSLIVATEACIDMASHLIATNRWRPPKDAADTFRVLRENGFLTPELAGRLEEMARFRNRLVHVYWDIDDALIYEYLRKDLEDVPAFLDRVLSLLR